MRGVTRGRRTQGVAKGGRCSSDLSVGIPIPHPITMALLSLPVVILGSDLAWGLLHAEGRDPGKDHLAPGFITFTFSTKRVDRQWARFFMALHLLQSLYAGAK